MRSKKRTERGPAPTPPIDADRPKLAPQPRFCSTIFDQETARERRQKDCYSVQYTGENFSLSAEVRGLCGPLAAEMTVLFSGPLAGRVVGGTGEVPFAAEVGELAVAVHGLVVDVVRILGDRELRSSVGGRAVAAAVVSDPTFGPPEIAVEDLESGAWVEVLAAHVARLDVELAAQLGRAALPDGRVSDASCTLSEALGGASMLSMKLRHLERKIGESKIAVQWDATSARLAADERERRSEQRLHALGLS